MTRIIIALLALSTLCWIALGIMGSNLLYLAGAAISVAALALYAAIHFKHKKV